MVFATQIESCSLAEAIYVLVGVLPHQETTKDKMMHMHPCNYFLVPLYSPARFSESFLFFSSSSSSSERVTGNVCRAHLVLITSSLLMKYLKLSGVNVCMQQKLFAS